MKRILLIDDDNSIRRLISSELADAGYKVFEAANGCEGLKFYRELNTDLVITDLVMPVKEGIETIIELRRDFPAVKIIAISGGNRYGNDAYLRNAALLGAKRTLAKPFKIRHLLGAVREVLEAS